MNFIQQILEAGFTEQGQKQLVTSMPHKSNWIPKWWEDYPYEQHWFGVCVDHPDAWFRKEGFDGELQLSLNGIQTGHPSTQEDIILLDNCASRYICIKIANDKIYETFSGKIPPQDIMDTFIEASKK